MCQRHDIPLTPHKRDVLHPKSWTLNFVYIVFTDKIYPVLDRIHS